MNYNFHPEVKSLDAPLKHLVVLLHGLGSDGHDLISLVPLIQHELPSCHFFSPHGIEAFDMAPFGRQWFSLAVRELPVILNLLEQSSKELGRIIKAKQQELNLKNKDTILVGFSQGTMMALYLNLMQHDPFCAIVGFSGRLFAPPSCINKQTPICLIHGNEDDVVAVEELDNAVSYLTQNHIKHSSLKIPNLAHSIDNQGLSFAVDFIKSALKANNS